VAVTVVPDAAMPVAPWEHGETQRLECRRRRFRGCARNCKRRVLSKHATDGAQAQSGRLERDARAASQETDRHESPIPRAGRSVERFPVVATDVQPIGSYVRNARGIHDTLTD